MEKYPVLNRKNSLANLLDDFWEPKFLREDWLAPVMKTDVIEKDGKLLMEVEMPGMKKEDIKVSIKDGMLSIQGNHEENIEEKDEKGVVIRKERHSGSYSRSFYVGDNIKMEDVNGSYENGVLKLEIIKNEPEEKETKFVEIK